jgi:FtsH-binding integral membrane protein
MKKEDNMSNNFDPITRTSAHAQEIDAGLRTYMQRVYNFMALGLSITGITAYLTAQSPEMMQLIFGTPLRYLVLFGPLLMVFFLSARIGKMTFANAQTLFWAFAGVLGLSIASIFIVFEQESIAKVFFITAGMFAGTSLYGYTTQRDLSKFGSFLFMALLGIIIASVVNMFLHSGPMQFAISVLSVLIFTGLTAYDTQMIKEIYYANDDSETSGKKALFGALRLYMNFLNMFLALLQLFGNRR